MSEAQYLLKLLQTNQITPAALEKRIQELTIELDDAQFFKKSKDVIKSLETRINDIKQVLAQDYAATVARGVEPTTVKPTIPAIVPLKETLLAELYDGTRLTESEAKETQGLLKMAKDGKITKVTLLDLIEELEKDIEKTERKGKKEVPRLLELRMKKSIIQHVVMVGNFSKIIRPTFKKNRRNPRYRRNSDEKRGDAFLRQAERDFKLEPNRENFDILNRIRERFGLSSIAWVKIAPRCDWCNYPKDIDTLSCPQCDQERRARAAGEAAEGGYDPSYSDEYHRNPRYRKNSDDDLRQAGREFQLHPGYETLGNLNHIRKRMGIESLPDPRDSLQCGYRAGLPWGVTVAWGNRAILDDRGADMVYSSTIGSEDEKAELISGLNDNLLMREAQEEIRRLLKLWVLRRDENKEHLLADKAGFVILGNTNASHGYLYLIGFKKPEEWVGPSKYVEPPPPPPRPPLAPFSAMRIYDAILSYKEPFMVEASSAKIIVEKAKIGLTGKAGAKTVRGFFKWLILQNLKPETRTALEIELKANNIKIK